MGNLLLVLLGVVFGIAADALLRVAFRATLIIEPNTKRRDGLNSDIICVQVKNVGTGTASDCSASLALLPLSDGIRPYNAVWKGQPHADIHRGDSKTLDLITLNGRCVRLWSEDEQVDSEVSIIEAPIVMEVYITASEGVRPCRARFAITPHGDGVRMQMESRTRMRMQVRNLLRL